LYLWVRYIYPSLKEITQRNVFVSLGMLYIS